MISFDPKSTDVLNARRETVYIFLLGVFLASMVMLNIVGITKFIQIGPLSVAVGVLAYPLTFLCTDLVSEIYGRRRANWMVWVGLFLNLFVYFIMWLGDSLPSVALDKQPPWQTISLSMPIGLPNGSKASGSTELFGLVYACTSGAMLASMIAYLTAQFCDVYLFHFWKRLTKGKHLWIRNNGSTMVSQLVDSIAVISITFGAVFLRGEMPISVLLSLFLGNYIFKFIAALIDTIPMYLAVNFLSKYLQVNPEEEHSL